MGGLDAGTRAAAVRAPAFVRRIDPGQTGWFSSPSLVDLDGDHRLEIVAPFYSTYVYSAAGRRLATGTATTGREYAPSVVADLDRDGSPEIVVGGTGTVAAYGWRGGRPICPDGDWYPPSGIPAPALVDLTGDGRPEIVFPGDDGYVYAISSTGKRLWRWGYAPGRARGSAISACPGRGRTATGSGWRPRRPSPTWTATGPSRS